MLIEKGKRVRITFVRKAKFEAIAKRDFNTDTECMYPLAIESDLIDCFVTDCIKGDTVRVHRRFIRKIKVVS